MVQSDPIKTRELSANKFIVGTSQTPVTTQTTVSDPAACAAITFSNVWDGATDPSTAEGDTLDADLAALKTAIDANNTAIDLIIVRLKAFGLIA